MSGHTPGPWHIVRGYQSGKARGISSAAGNVVNFRGIAQQCGADPEANARLIAAAPDLLDALLHACAAMREPTGDWHDYRCNQALIRARTAIAKARPEEKTEGESWPRADRNYYTKGFP